MSANIGQIVAEITANTAGLRRGAAEAKSIMKDTSDGASVAGKAIGIAFAVTAALGVAKLIDKLEDCTQVAIDNKKALMGLESVAKAYGVSADEAKKATQSFTQDGLVQMKSATIGMKNIISTGFDITEAMNLSKALKDIGAFNNVTGDLGTAFEDATKGMRTGSIELIENIGLTQKLSAVMKAAGVDISNGIDLTNNAAQREAFYNMVLEEGEKFKGNAAKLANDQASSQAKANAAMKEAADAIGNRFLPVTSLYNDTVIALTTSIKKMFDKTAVDNANDYAKAINKQKTDFETLSGIYAELSKKTNKTAEELKVYRGVIEELKKLYPEYLDNIDMEKGKYEDVAKALDDVNKKLALKAVYARKEQELAKLSEKIASKEIKIRETQMETESQIAYAKKMNKNATNVAVLSTPKIKLGLISYVPLPVSMSFDDYRKKQQGYIDEYKKDIIGYRNEIDTINKKYAPILGGYDAKAEDKAKEDAAAKAAKKKATEEVAAKATREKAVKEWKPDTSKTLEQKKKELEYNLKADLANAKEEEKHLIQLKYNQAVKVAEAEDKYAKAIASAKTQKAAKTAMDTLIKSVGESEVELNVGIKVAEEAAAAKKKAEEWKPDTSKTLEQKKKELEYNLKADLVNAKEEEKYLIQLKYNQAVKVAEAEDKYAKAIASAKTQKAAEDAMDTLIKSVGESEIELNVGIKVTEEAAAIWKEIQKKRTGYGPMKIGAELPDKNKKPPKTQEELDKELNEAINKTISSFTALANELDNNFMKALANIAESAMSMKNSYGTFATGQAQGGLLGGLGMLSGGIGMFTSAVSIFQSVGGLFHKSTYNFDEAVQKMLKGIGEKAPDIQVAQFNKATKAKEVYDKYLHAVLTSGGQKGYGYIGDGKNNPLTNEELAIIQAAGGNVVEKGKGNYEWYFDRATVEMIANLDKIVPQLAEQLGTSAKDFGSDIASALSNTSTFADFSSNLEDNVFSSVKSGLISAFIASDAMKNLLEPLQKSITLAVADDYKISDSEMNDIKAQMEGIENIAKPFYDALEAVGLNVVDAAGQLNEAADRMDNVNRNLRLADRISTITTQTSVAGITQLAGNSNIVYDFSNANLGGMTEQQVISAVSKANRMASIRKVGV